MQKIKFFLIPVLLLFLSSCIFRESVYRGVAYPATSRVKVSFQEHAISKTCVAFAHLIMSTKGYSTGEEIAHSIYYEAMNKGADLILVGMAREVAGENLEENSFDYYGPKYAYNFNKTWLGWKFGFGQWNEGDKLVGLGAASWERADINYEDTMLIQAVFLRCEAND